jgi:hypothetical protein
MAPSTISDINTNFEAYSDEKTLNILSLIRFANAQLDNTSYSLILDPNLSFLAIKCNLKSIISFRIAFS